MVKLRNAQGEPITCLTCKEELTASQYVRLVKEVDYTLPVEERNWLACINILCGTDYKEMSLADQSTFYPFIEWALFGVDFSEQQLPKFVDILGSMYEVPDEIGSLSIGQSIRLKQEINKAGSLQAAIVIATAIYMQPVLDSKEFDSKRVQHYLPIIEAMPASAVFPIGFFFLLKLHPNGTDLTKHNNQILLSLLLVLNNWSALWLMAAGWLGFRTLMLLRNMHSYLVKIPMKFIREVLWTP